MRTITRLCLVAMVAVVGAASSASAADHVVLMNGDYFVTFFDPPLITIDAGDRIQWQNVTPIVHTSTSGSDCAPDGLWNTGSVNPGASSAFFTFNTVGTFAYYCRFHCEMGMTGEVVVRQPPVRTQKSTWGAIKALYTAAAGG